MHASLSRRSLIASVLALGACAAPPDTTLLVAEESGMPYFSKGPDGRIHLAWVDFLPDGGHALRTSAWNGRRWSEIETIASGQKWFVNWADAPSIAAMPDGSLFAHWLARPLEGGKYGYGIRIAHRPASGGDWREVHGINLEDKEDYAGFLRFAPDAPFAVYLCPPNRVASPDEQHEHHSGDKHHGGHKPQATEHDHEAGHRKTFRLIEFNTDGSVVRDREVDPDVCTCCPTALGRTTDGWIAAYRDHRPGEIRDISFVRFDGKSWSDPQPVHPDGWELRGCPVEGPSIATLDNDVLVAWLTRANKVTRVHYVCSADGGKTFGNATVLDDGNPVGRPHVVPLDRQHYLAMWVEKTEGAECELRARRISRQGVTSSSTVLATVPGARAAGYPRIALHDNEILLAWRDKRVKTLHLPVSQFLRKVS